MNKWFRLCAAVLPAALLLAGCPVSEGEMEITLKITALGDVTPFTTPVLPKSSAEVPPVFFNVDGQVYVINSNETSWIAPVTAGSSPLIDVDAYDELAAIMAGGSRILPPPDGVEQDPEDINDMGVYWGRTYYGLYDAAVFTGPDGKKYVAATIHGENKNYYYNGKRYKNSIKPLDTVYEPHEYSGDVDGSGWRDYWDDYFGFVGLCLAPLDNTGWKELYKFDKGPVIWPVSRYLKPESDTSIVSVGMRHPRLFIDDGYMYLFYLDESASVETEPGRLQGIKAARSPLSALGEPGSWKKYYNGGFTEDGLPPGFVKEDRQFFSQRGGRADTIISGEGILSFSVAKVNGTEFYLGVYKAYVPVGTGWKHVVKLTASRDLMNWSEGVEVPGTDTPGRVWWESPMQYPLFCNLALTDNHRIDKDGFFILGAKSREASYIKVAVAIR